MFVPTWCARQGPAGRDGDCAVRRIDPAWIRIMRAPGKRGGAVGRAELAAFLARNETTTTTGAAAGTGGGANDGLFHPMKCVLGCDENDGGIVAGKHRDVALRGRSRAALRKP